MIQKAQKARKRKRNEPQLASAFFCNSSHVAAATGKFDCQGIFTSFYAWSYPTSIRTWHSIVTAYNLTEETKSVAAAIITPKKEKHSLKTVDAKLTSRDVGNIIQIPLEFQFEKEGDYLIEFTLIGTKEKLLIPLRIATHEWPKFSRRDLEFLRATTAIPKAIRVNIECVKCRSAYLFEHSPLPEHELAPNTKPFPKSGTFECENCEHHLNLKDLQGQLLFALISAIKQQKGATK